MSHIESLGAGATLLDVYRRYPAIAGPVLGLAEAAFTLTGEIGRGECEAIGAYVSQLNGCGYCRGVHTEAAVACGVGRGAFGPEGAPALEGPRWPPAFAYLRALTLAPATVTAGHVTALRAAGWSDDAVVQLAAVAAAFSVLNRLVDGLGLVADEAFQAQAGRRLSKVGYGGTARMLGLTG